MPNPARPNGLVPLLAWFLATASVAGAQEKLDDLLAPALVEHKIPAFAAAVVKDGEIVAAGAVGTRRTDSSIPVGLDDRFHLGSDTKARTALLVGMLVDEGKLRRDSTIADIFPEMAKELVPGLRSITLEQFLSHTSGLPADNEAFMKAIEEASQREENLDAMRAWLNKKWGSGPPELVPAGKFVYSNMNYVIAGAMAEKTAGRTWEELIVDRVFTPLGLKTAGLGPQSTLGRIDAPLGHAVVGGTPRAFLAGPAGDNPVVLGPAGLAHMSVLDFARWAGWNAAEGRRGPALVKPETLKKVHTPVVSMPEIKSAAPGTPNRGRYGLGWGELTVDWAPQPVLYHGGSNGKNLAQIWVDPGRDFAMVLMTNIGGVDAERALFEVAPKLHARYSKVNPKAGR
jgi:CubicO group peptidase (beta-lactamase class C family)